MKDRLTRAQELVGDAVWACVCYVLLLVLIGLGTCTGSGS